MSLINEVDKLTDEKLGIIVRSLIKSCCKISLEREIELASVLSLLLVDVVHNNNSEFSEINLDNIIIKDENIGDWVVSVNKINNGDEDDRKRND